MASRVVPGVGQVGVFGPDSALAREVRVLALAKLGDYLQPVAADAVSRADANVERLYNTDRSGYESKGGIPLKGSFYAKVVPSMGDFPVKVILNSHADEGKVWSLELGSPAHPITGDPLVFRADATAAFTGLFTRPALQNTGKRKRRSTGAKTDLSGTGGLTRPRVVDHPGNAPGKFMQRALDAAMQARLRLSRSLVD